jgi:ubiquinone/menaquinone biosynthesis C-methylase UbiE
MYIEDTPVYNASHFEEIKNKMILAWPEEGRGEKYPDRPIYSYEFAKKFINEDDVVLDIACGSGYGTNLLTTATKKGCVGVDIQQDLIEFASERFNDNKQLKFIQSDFSALDFDNYFNKIISLHTMEHVSDDDYFLKKLHFFLKSGGELLLEVPILRIRPFVGIPTPINPDHIIEYKIDELLNKVANHFNIIESYGVNHGLYTNKEKATSAIFVRAIK